MILLDSPTSGFSADSFLEGSEDGIADDKKSIKDSKASKWRTKSKDENETLSLCLVLSWVVLNSGPSLSAYK